MAADARGAASTSRIGRQSRHDQFHVAGRISPSRSRDVSPKNPTVLRS